MLHLGDYWKNIIAQSLEENLRFCIFEFLLASMRINTFRIFFDIKVQGRGARLLRLLTGLLPILRILHLPRFRPLLLLGLLGLLRLFL